MNLRVSLLSIVVTVMFSGCTENDPEPKCTTKAITYKEFTEYQEKQKAKSTSNTQNKNSNSLWKTVQ